MNNRFNFACLLVLAFLLAVSAISGVLFSPSAAAADKFEIKPVAERKISKLPAGALYWEIEKFSTLPRVSRAIRTVPREAARTRRACGIRTP